MANNGFKQAVIAYKVRAADGVPVGVDGFPISETGAKQAIALLNGATNPDASLYEVELTYNVDDAIDGVPTVETSEDCLSGYISLSTYSLVFLLGTAPQVIQVTSSGTWHATPTGSPVATLSAYSGDRGVTNVTVTRSASTLGEMDITFINDDTLQTVVLHIVNVDTDVWVLQTGVFNGRGFWHGDGVFRTT
jgi:hypothetical protein